MTPLATLDALRAHIGDCTRCKLHTLGRRQVVFGVGNPKARSDVRRRGAGRRRGPRRASRSSDAPGSCSRRSSRRFGLSARDVYIANVIKCRPPGNRNPEPDEVATCEPFLLPADRHSSVRASSSRSARSPRTRCSRPTRRSRGCAAACTTSAAASSSFRRSIPPSSCAVPDRKRDVWEDMKKVRALLAERD